VRLRAYDHPLAGPTSTSLANWLLIRPFREEAAPIEAPLSDSAWDRFLRFVEEQRVTGLLQAAIGAMPTIESQRRSAALAHRIAIATDLRIEATLLTLAEGFDRQQISWRVIKGVAGARQLYPDPSLRTTGDVDVVVLPSHYRSALEAVGQAFEVAADYPAHGPASARHGKGHTFVTVDGVELDVHRAVRGPLRRYEIPTAALFSAPQSIRIRERDLPVPTTCVTVLQAMLHLAKEGGRTGTPARLSTLSDVLFAREFHPRAYLEAQALAATCGCATPAAWADAVAEAWLPRRVAETPSTGQASVPWAVTAYDLMLSRPGLVSILRRLEGPERLQRAWEAAVPSREFRERHGSSVPAQLRYVARRLMPGSGPPTRSRRR
jgi:hypothetical protein